MVSLHKHIGLFFLSLLLLFFPCSADADTFELTGKISRVDRSVRRLELDQGGGNRFPILWNDETVFLDGKDGAVSPMVFFDLFSSGPIWLSVVEEGKNLLALTVSVALEIQ